MKFIASCYSSASKYILPGNEDDSGNLFEAGGGWAAQVRWQRAGGYGFPTNKPLEPEDIIKKWRIITNFGRTRVAHFPLANLIIVIDDGRATNPSSTQEAIAQVVWVNLIVYVNLTSVNIVR
jgi:multifunctional beta-oxidation protein